MPADSGSAAAAYVWELNLLQISEVFLCSRYFHISCNLWDGRALSQTLLQYFKDNGVASIYCHGSNPSCAFMRQQCGTVCGFLSFGWPGAMSCMMLWTYNNLCSMRNWADVLHLFGMVGFFSNCIAQFLVEHWVRSTYHLLPCAVLVWGLVWHVLFDLGLEFGSKV